MQQKLRGQLSVNAAAVVRYLYGVPVGALLLGLYMLVFGGTLPLPGWAFLALCAAGGLGQILGTNLLIMAFGHRGFAVGTAYAKTEAVQGAILALVLLGSGSQRWPGSASRSASSACCGSRWRARRPRCANWRWPRCSRPRSAAWRRGSSSPRPACW
ncbi:hypothetical protein ACFQU2_29615 [Siccirubricoccus deserti]